MGSLAPVFMDLHVQCPIFLTNDDENVESHFFHGNDRMNSKGIAEDVT